MFANSPTARQVSEASLGLTARQRPEAGKSPRSCPTPKQTWFWARDKVFCLTASTIMEGIGVPTLIWVQEPAVIMYAQDRSLK